MTNDSGNQLLYIKELESTGCIHDWSISCKIRERVDVPIFLAGGLKPENVGSAVNKVGSFGLDICSGNRSNEKLDKHKLKHFSRKINSI